MLPRVTPIAMSYAASITVSLIVVFGIVFPALVMGLLSVAGAIADGERRQNDAYEEQITARK